VFGGKEKKAKYDRHFASKYPAPSNLAFFFSKYQTPHPTTGLIRKKKYNMGGFKQSLLHDSIGANKMNWA
jgi:hypothetical protein